MVTSFGLVGAGGFGREVMVSVREVADLMSERDGPPSICFVDQRAAELGTVNGIPVLTEGQFLQKDGDKKFNIAISDSKIRQQFADRLSASATPDTIYGQHVVIGDYVDIGEGAIICAFSMLTANARIGKFFHCNIYSYVAHDCVIGDFVTFAPRVCCNGRVHIGDHAYIGTGAVIREGGSGQPLTIGEGAIVGMGAVVIKDVAPYTTVVGNPARPIERKAPSSR